MNWQNPAAYDLSWDDGENTPKLRRAAWEPQTKEPNVVVDVGNYDVGACYICGQNSNLKVVFNPYPKLKESDRDVQPYKIRLCGWCVKDYELAPVTVT